MSFSLLYWICSSSGVSTTVTVSSPRRPSARPVMVTSPSRSGAVNTSPRISPSEASRSTSPRMGIKLVSTRLARISMELPAMTYWLSAER